jgi:hypothetical protein
VLAPRLAPRGGPPWCPDPRPGPDPRPEPRPLWDGGSWPESHSGVGGGTGRGGEVGGCPFAAANSLLRCKFISNTSNNSLMNLL